MLPMFFIFFIYHIQNRLKKISHTVNKLLSLGKIITQHHYHIIYAITLAMLFEQI